MEDSKSFFYLDEFQFLWREMSKKLLSMIWSWNITLGCAVSDLSGS
jgi:hypothetical protein